MRTRLSDVCAETYPPPGAAAPSHFRRFVLQVFDLWWAVLDRTSDPCRVKAVLYR